MQFSKTEDIDALHSGFAGLTWQVHKFGGTSVANADCFKAVARILESRINQSNIMVVVSAMGGKPKVTDLLLGAVSLASQREPVLERLEMVLNKHQQCLHELFGADHEISKELIQVIQQDITNIEDILKTVSLMKWNAERISEVVSGYGELWSAQILAKLLQFRAHKRETGSSNSLHPEAQHEFMYLDAKRVITVDETDTQQDGSVCWDKSADKLADVYASKIGEMKATGKADHVLHWIMTGYVASNTSGVATTLKRDGSDYSAAIVGRLLSSNSITIWTDVDGVLSADPRRVPLAQVLQEVSYSEAMELAFFGAKVIHPKTMQPAILADPQIPIYIRNTFRPEFRGTRIFTFGTATISSTSDKVVCGFTSIDGMALINVEGSGMIGVQGVLRRIFGTLEGMGISAVLISQASSEHSVTFALVEQEADRAKAVVEEEFARELAANRLTQIDLLKPCSIIAAVGDGMLRKTGVSGLFFSALGDAKINVLAIAQGSSERNISAVVRTEDSARALRAVHAAFRLSHTTIRVGIVGMNGELGDSLLKLLKDRRMALRETFEVDLQVVAALPSSKSSEIVLLEKDQDGGSNSITIESFNAATGGGLLLGASAESAVSSKGSSTVLKPGGLDSLAEHLVRNECTNHVIFDCTNDTSVGKYHAAWLRAGIDVVTANNTGLSGSKEERQELDAAQKMGTNGGQKPSRYLREVTVAGGLPILHTARTLLHTGDRIRRIDGILSVSLSYILFRLSPPTEIARCSEFDETSSNGAFRGDLLTSPSSSISDSCSLSTAVREAVALGLMEEDVTLDISNEYTSRVMMVLSQELGIADQETSDIQQNSDKLLPNAANLDFNNITPDMDKHMAERVQAAKSRGCVLRQISSVDVATKEVQIKIMEVPEQHIFAITPPSCACVRFFTHRHRRYPLIVQGPSAGADSTASALLADLLQIMRGNTASPRLGLTRNETSAALKREASAPRVGL